MSIFFVFPSFWKKALAEWAIWAGTGSGQTKVLTSQMFINKT